MTPAATPPASSTTFQMRQAFIVTDLGFGDSGKGAMTDRLANAANRQFAREDIVVVRSTGGSQAGHTVEIDVVDPGSKETTRLRHVHSSFASGALGGFASHMSSFCPIFPQNLVREARILRASAMGLWSSLSVDRIKHTVDPLAPLITVYDVAWNRLTKTGRNTVGLGIGATMKRMQNTELRTFMSDLLNRRLLNHKLQRVRLYYEKLMYSENIAHRREDYYDIVAQEFEDPVAALEAVELKPTSEVIDSHAVVIFEGAQGVMLDQDHGFIPQVTWGHTTSRNACQMIMDRKQRPDHVALHHVTRSYQTRHGDGPMTSRQISVPADKTNVWNDCQGEFRTGALDVELLKYAAIVDRAYTAAMESAIPCTKILDVTCCDHVSLDSNGTLRNDLLAAFPEHSVVEWHGPQRDAIAGLANCIKPE